MACSSGGNRFEEAAFQYKVDSTVNSRIDSVQNSLQHRNDSLILEAARHRADSMKRNPLILPPSAPGVSPPPPPPAQP